VKILGRWLLSSRLGQNYLDSLVKAAELHDERCLNMHLQFTGFLSWQTQTLWSKGHIRSDFCLQEDMIVLGNPGDVGENSVVEEAADPSHHCGF
jgi:hypothetical protein